MRAVKTPRRSLGHNGGWRAAKKDGARSGGRFPPGPPAPTRAVDRIGPICAPGFPPPSPLGASFGRAQFAPGKGNVGKLKRLCLLRSCASLGDRPTSSRGPGSYFFSKELDDNDCRGRAATGMVSACCATDRQYPRID
jgi:hypothetical protein